MSADIFALMYVRFLPPPRPAERKFASAALLPTTGLPGGSHAGAFHGQPVPFEAGCDGGAAVQAEQRTWSVNARRQLCPTGAGQPPLTVPPRHC